MFARHLCLAALASVTVAACAPPASVPKVASATFGPINQACAGREGWSDAAPPAHVFGNVYMVGTCGIVSLLITTPQGHFLIDGATHEAAQGIADNIRKLGFDPRDVRYLIATHEHIDHAGGLAELKRITGAQFITRSAAQAAMESGQPHADDPQRGGIPGFEGIKADRIIEDGAKLTLGGQSLTLIATPGHTPGGNSWTWKSCEGKSYEGKICRQIVYVDSLNAVSTDAYRFSDHPTYVATLRASMARIAGLKSCDMVISPHPGQSQFFERLSGAPALVDKEGCKAYADAAAARLDARLAKEAATKDAAQ